MNPQLAIATSSALLGAAIVLASWYLIKTRGTGPAWLVLTLALLFLGVQELAGLSLKRDNLWPNRELAGSVKLIGAIGAGLLVAAVVLIGRMFTSLEKAGNALRASFARLKASEDRFRRLAEGAPHILFRFHLGEDRFEYVSPAALRLSGYSPAEWTADAGFLERAVHPDWYKTVRRHFVAVCRAQESESNLEFQICRKDGQIRIFRQSSVLVFDAADRPIAIEGIIDDVTERRQAEAALRESEERYALAVRGANDGLWDWNLHSGQLHCSPRWRAMLGFPDDAEPLESEAWLQRVHPEDVAAVRREIDTHLKGLSSFLRSEHRINHPKTGVRWMLVRGQAVRDATGSPIRMVGSQTDMTERKRVLEALRESEERYRLVVELCPEAIVVHADGKVTYINQAGAKLFGASNPGQLVGRNVLDFVHPEFREFAANRIARIRRDGIDTTPAREKLLRLDGSVIDVEVVGAAIPVNGKTANLAVVRDIAERKLWEQRLIEAREGALAASRAKSDFLAAVSHELRTPLHQIFIAADLIAATELSAEQAEYLEIYRRAADTLLNLIDDLLDLAQVEAGRIEIKSTPFAMSDLVDAAIKPAESLAVQKGLNLSAVVKPGVPARVVGDTNRILQVLANLINNAIKFTDAGSVCLTIEPDADGLSAGDLRFTVTDTGIGIARDKLDKVFRVFTQADGSIFRRYGGTGLGLAICKRLVEKMNGRIWVLSELGRGTSLIFTLPLGLPPDAAGPAPVSVPAESSPTASAG